jgi:hypothetical protein
MRNSRSKVSWLGMPCGSDHARQVHFMVKKFKKRVEPIVFQQREGMNFGEGVGVADHGKNRNANNVGKVVTNAACCSRVRKVGKVLEQAGWVDVWHGSGYQPDFAVTLCRC